MEIRRYQINNRRELKDHIPHLQEMCDYFTPLSGWMEKQLQSASDILYAMKDETLLGYVIGDKRSRHFEVELICVGKEGRSMKGIGTKLMNECERLATEYGLKEIRLDAQPEAVGFYKKLGFIELEKVKHGSLMKKSLKE
jgi:ribosomal protein S18 acetylase RimI-like enzyme